MSPKWPFVLKSDIKKWFTTTELLWIHIHIDAHWFIGMDLVVRELINQQKLTNRSLHCKSHPPPPAAIFDDSKWPPLKAKWKIIWSSPPTSKWLNGFGLNMLNLRLATATHTHLEEVKSMTSVEVGTEWFWHQHASSMVNHIIWRPNVTFSDDKICLSIIYDKQTYSIHDENCTSNSQFVWDYCTLQSTWKAA